MEENHNQYSYAPPSMSQPQQSLQRDSMNHHQPTHFPQAQPHKYSVLPATGPSPFVSYSHQQNFLQPVQPTTPMSPHHTSYPQSISFTLQYALD